MEMGLGIGGLGGGIAGRGGALGRGSRVSRES